MRDYNEVYWSVSQTMVQSIIRMENSGWIKSGFYIYIYIYSDYVHDIYPISKKKYCFTIKNSGVGHSNANTLLNHEINYKH